MIRVIQKFDIGYNEIVDHIVISEIDVPALQVITIRFGAGSNVAAYRTTYVDRSFETSQ